MYRTMYAIMQYQQNFKTGDERKLKPMISKDIADISGYDILRYPGWQIVNLVQTEYGTKRLKEFFLNPYKTRKEKRSPPRSEKIIPDMVSGESKKKPFRRKIKTTRTKGVITSLAAP